MEKRPFIRIILKASFWALVSVVGLVSYLNLRAWFIPIVNNIWVVGFLEGVASMIIVLYYADKYGGAIYEVVQGLRELGEQREKREASIHLDKK